MTNWFKYPFIRLLMPFVLGIWLSFSCLNLPKDELNIVFGAVVVSGVALFVVHSAVKDYKYRWVFGAILNLHLILIGIAIVHIRNDDLDEDCDVWVARLAECPTEKGKTVKVVLEMQSATGSVMAYFEKNERSLNLNYGDVIAFYEPPKLVEPPSNPEQFDYQKYLSRKGILRQVYLKVESWDLLKDKSVNPIYSFSYNLRNFLLATIRELGISDDEYSVAAAILLGYDDTLPTELRQKYVAAGSMHILCVSGMHVGVIFMVFSYMLGFLDKRKRGQNVTKQILLLVLIWFYALLAGLAPSILRSTIMLSFVIVGDMIKRNGILLNSLAASAFLLLCIDPANLFNVGFLLSYCAVIGIVTLQKPIYNIFYVKPKFLDKVWEMTSVTLAAQLATAPLSIYYFHQFPTYFWLSNLFMGPISAIVITGGMVMLMVFFIPYINIGVAFCVKWLIYAMNFIVSWIETMPLSMIKGLYINSLEFICLIIAFVLLMMLVEYRKKPFLFGILSMLLIFSVSQLTSAVIQRDKMSITVYSVNKASAIDFVCGNEHVLICDSIFVNNPSLSNFSIENHLIREGVFSNGVCVPVDSSYFNSDYLKKRDNLISFGGKIIGIMDEKSSFGVKMPFRPHLDYFIVRGRVNIDLERLLNCYVIDLLVIDSSVPEYVSQKIIQKAEDMEQDYYYVKTSGAYVYNL
ncbi:MAG: ComEC family competence protein [Bacteroidales bacterium]|nr:ComEC family competence protein [Bacteroidales bacterium]